MTTYQFDRQLAQGEAGEVQLDRHFCRWYRIFQVSRAYQRRGIDRVFVHRETGKSYTVEYKTDRRAGQTGNAFIETISIDTPPQVAGWVYTCQADYLVYFCPAPDTIYVLLPAVLRSVVGEWAAKYPARAIRNDGYNTHGVLVPLYELEKVAVVVY